MPGMRGGAEIFLRSADNEGVECTNCGSKKLERLFSASCTIRIGGASAPGRTCCSMAESCGGSSCSSCGVGGG